MHWPDIRQGHHLKNAPNLFLHDHVYGALSIVNSEPWFTAPLYKQYPSGRGVNYISLHPWVINTRSRTAERNYGMFIHSLSLTRSLAISLLLSVAPPCKFD